MARVGEGLREERETRNTSIADLSQASGIGESYLEALERGEIDALPGPAFGKLYIRAYAEVLGFDPQPWIDAYDRERRLARTGEDEPAPKLAQGERRVAAALARWKESRSASQPVAEMERPLDEPAVEPAAPAAETTAAVDPDPPPEPVPEPSPRIDPTPDPQPRPEDDPEPEPGRQPPRREPEVGPPIRAGRVFAFAGSVLAAAALIAWLFAGRGDAGAPKPQPTPAAAVLPQSKPTAEPSPVQAAAPPPSEPVEAAPPPPRLAPAPVEASGPGSLSVVESGTGRRIVASTLEGKGTEFTEGESVVFQTRVVNGSRGETIRHVWIFDGRAQQSISLRLGSPDWRTHSKKTLYKRGSWRVEARDSRGTVLASASFTCNPASRR
jgi:hypothetical protein